MLDERDARTLVELKRADGATFAELIEIAGLDPGRDLRDADLGGVDFAGCDLAGYDFSGARLVGSSFRDALVDKAIFDRADLTSVRWPRGYAPGADGRVRRSSRPQLHARQREIADALLRAMRKGRAPRAVAVLPPGVGKSAILSEVFAGLKREKSFRSGLVLTETVAERIEVMALLRERGIDTSNARQVERHGSIERGTLMVDTFGNYYRVRGDLEPGSDDRPNPFKCSHVAFMSLPTRRRSGTAAIIGMPDAPAALAFIEPAAGSRIEERLTRRRLGELFGEITFRYDVAQAVEDGLLGTSSIIDRTSAIARFRDRGGHPDDRGAAVIEEVGRNFIEELETLSSAASSLMIVPDVEIVGLMADVLRDEMRFSNTGRVRGQAVVPLTTRLNRAGRDRATRESDAVVVTTSAMADDLDLRRFDLVGTLAPVSPRLGALLRNPPLSRDGGRLTVVDYAGTVTLTVEAVGRA